MKLKEVNHIAIIASDIERSIAFYVDVLGFTIIRKVYREERDSWKVDLALNGDYLIELFTFPDAPQRPSYPEALGLRHLAFTVDDIETSISELQSKGIETESIRIDPFTGYKCVFFADPDGLPIELVEVR
ncbi:MAG: VOC family protein [Prevotellaceae bacterium]|nr:VOC family protein [Prevotellaceae bacterium]